MTGFHFVLFQPYCCTSCPAAVPRQREEPQLRRRDDTKLRQGRAAQSVPRYHGARDRP